MNIYIFKFIGSLQILAIFSISMLCSHFIGFLCTSLVIKRWYRNILSIGSLFWIATIFFLFAYDISLIQSYYILISIILWFLSWVYWCVNGNNQFDLTVPKNRWNYEWWKKWLRTINAIITPIVIGAIISTNLFWDGYSYAFLVWWILFILSGLLSTIDESKIQKHVDWFQFWKILQEVRSHTSIIYILIIIFLTWFALSTNVIEVITPLVLVDWWLNELSIGAFISFISVISIVASFIFWKFVDYKYYKFSVLIAWAVYIGLILNLILFPNQLNFHIFVTSLALLYVFIDIPVVVYASNYLHEIPNYKFLRSEYILLREFATISWRLIMFIPILFISSFNIESISIIFILMCISILWVMFLFSSLKTPKIH